MPYFLENLLSLTNESESPTSFFTWSGLAAISAITRKNVYFNKKIYKVYPNLYVMLVARSGLRKGFPVKLAQRLVEAVEVCKVLSGRNSIQSIIKELSIQRTTESGKVLTHAHGFIVNDELDSLLIDDPQAQTILTTLYDAHYHKNWTNTLKSEGKETLKDIYITLLGATNETHLGNFLHASSSTGGFIGRTVIIKETKRARINPLISENEEEDDKLEELDLEPLIADLKRMALLQGRLRMTKEAKGVYIPWYHEFNRKLDDDPTFDETGTSERIGDLVIKLSMLLSVSERDDLIITSEHVNRSLEWCERLIPTAKEVVLGKGKSEGAEKNKIFLDYLLGQPDFKACRRRILSAKFGDLDAIDLDKIVDNFTQAGFLETGSSPQGPVYGLTKEYAEKFKNYVSGRKVIVA